MLTNLLLALVLSLLTMLPGCAGWPSSQPQTPQQQQQAIAEAGAVAQTGINNAGNPTFWVSLGSSLLLLLLGGRAQAQQAAATAKAQATADLAHSKAEDAKADVGSLYQPISAAPPGK